MRRRLRLAFLAATVLGLVLAWAPSSASVVAAAGPDLTITSAARYLVEPDSARVRVVADLHLTSHTKDTATRRYYFDRASLAVLPGTSAFSLSGSGGLPSVRVAKKTARYTLLTLALGTKVYSGGTLDLRLAFDLKDPGGAPTRDVRIGQTVATFPVWAFATDATPGSSVEVVFPSGFTIDVPSGSLKGPTTAADGSLVLRSGTLTQPLSFFAYVVADREGSLTEERRSVELGGKTATVLVRSWPDDPSFGQRVGDLFSRGLPALESAIGLPYPRTEPLIARELVSRSIGGYAGLFDPTKGEIAVDYAAPPFVVLHEAAHVWFNGALLADRWADEAFASYYATRVGPALGLTATGDELTPDLLAAKIPLNSWIAGGSDPDRTSEAYAYAASLALARAIADRAGDAALQQVWADAAARRSAYQPSHPDGPPELTSGAPDWRGLLDLLEGRTGKSFEDLWRTWVDRPEDDAVLATRAQVRSGYEQVVDQAGTWELPRSIRAAMTAWEFEEAAGLLSQAEGVLAERDGVATRSTAAGLTPPATLRDLFEGDRGLRAADAEAQTELAAIDAYVAAGASQEAAPDPIEALGLIGATPAADLQAAATAFAAGDLQASVEKAEAARIAWLSAGDVGRRRAITILGGVAIVLVLVVIAGLAVRDRRRPRRSEATAGPVMAHRRDAGAAPTERGTEHGTPGRPGP